MKKLLFILFIATSGTAMAQPANVVNAYNYLNEGKLDKAKEAIDKAAEHPKTSVKEKTWRYRGNIYFAILMSADENYKALSDNPGQVALDSYNKSIKLDKKGSYHNECKKNLGIIQNKALNDGVEKFNNKDYGNALNYFKTAMNAAETRGKVDTLAMYNCGLASERAEKFDDAIKYYSQCEELGYRGETMCGFIIYLHQKQGNDEAMKTKLTECRAKYPNDQNLIITELNIYINSGDFDGAKNNLEAAIANDPNNHILYFSYGSVLDNNGKVTEAEEAYKKALEIEPEYFDANYNLGALYYNLGVEENNKINEITDNKKYKEAKMKVDEIFKQSLPYLEKARELKADDLNTLSSLKQVYARLGMTDKYQEVDKAIKALQG